MRNGLAATLVAGLIGAAIVACGSASTPEPSTPVATATATPSGPVAGPVASPTPNGGNAQHPAWLEELIRSYEQAPVSNPPAKILSYQYLGETVNYVPPVCCDIFSDLFDSNGVLMGHPDGGITGNGDGQFPDFSSLRSGETPVWEDARQYPADRTLVEAPVERIEVLVEEGSPPRYNLSVASGLPSSCSEPAGYTVDRQGENVRVSVTNWEPSGGDTVCAQVYRTHQATITLGAGFEPGKTYTVEVHGLTGTFTAR